MPSLAERATDVSATIARHIIATRFADLSPHTVEIVKRSLLDAIGVSLAASGLSPAVKPFADLARAGRGAAEATILGFGGKTSAAAAAFANGALAHAVDYEDSYDLSPCHPNASLVPAALAVAEASEGVSGRDFLVAMAVGSDLVCRMGLSLRQTMEESGWYPPPILGAFGAAAATSKLIGLTEEQISDAFSLLMCQVTCSGEIMHSARAEIRAVREAFPAQAAVQSAELAARGVAGFEAPFEGKSGFFRLYVDGRYDAATLLSNLGRKFYGEDVSFKPWPSCRGTHPFIQAVLELMREPGFQWPDVAEVRASGSDVHAMLVEPRDNKIAPKTVIDAKFSIPFAVATALKDGSVTLDSFGPDALADRDKRALAAKVSFSLRPGWGREKAASAELTVILKSGLELRRSIEDATGHPNKPMSREQLIAKFVDCAGRAARPLARDRAEAAAQRILSLEHETNMRDVVASVAAE